MLDSDKFYNNEVCYVIVDLSYTRKTSHFFFNYMAIFLNEIVLFSMYYLINVHKVWNHFRSMEKIWLNLQIRFIWFEKKTFIFYLSILKIYNIYWYCIMYKIYIIEVYVYVLYNIITMKYITIKRKVVLIISIISMYICIL